MTQEISSLMDGELEAHEAERVDPLVLREQRGGG